MFLILLKFIVSKNILITTTQDSKIEIRLKDVKFEPLTLLYHSSLI